MKNNNGTLFMLILLIYNIFLKFTISIIYYNYLQDSFIAGFFSTPWFIITGQVLSFLLPLSIWLAFTRDRLSPNLPNMKLGRINIIFIIAICFFLQPAIMLFAALTSLIFPNNVADTLSTMRDVPFPVMVAALAVTPALCEEVTFRGYILHQYRHLDIKKSAWITGLFFAIMHLDAHQFTYAFLLGMVLAVFVYYTRSIRAGVLAHFFINFFQISIARLASHAPQDAVQFTSEFEIGAQTWPFMVGLAVFAFIFLAGAAVLFPAFLSHNRLRNTKHDIKNMWSMEVPPQSEKPVRALDIYFWLVIAVYLGYMAFTIYLTIFLANGNMP